ncbi:MAG: hypothetical protein ABGY09_03885 [Euryarchaeota archaeon]
MSCLTSRVRATLRLRVPDPVLLALIPDADPWCRVRDRRIHLRGDGFGSLKHAVDDVLRCVKAGLSTLRVTENAAADAEEQGRAPGRDRPGHDDHPR